MASNAPNEAARNIIADASNWDTTTPGIYYDFADGSFTLYSNEPGGGTVDMSFIGQLFSDAIFKCTVQAISGSNAAFFSLYGNGAPVAGTWGLGAGGTNPPAMTLDIDMSVSATPPISARAWSTSNFEVKITPAAPPISLLLKCVDGHHVPMEEGDTFPPEMVNLIGRIQAGENISLSPLPGGKILISNLCCPDGPAGKITYEGLEVGEEQ